MSSDPRRREMEVLLEDLSYAITAARSAGMDDIDRLRGILRNIRDIGADLDGLAGSIVAEKQAAEG